jgi:hypothetical protein
MRTHVQERRADSRRVEGAHVMRRLPGAVALGLLTAFLAHTVVYGSGHAMGGSYCAALRAFASTAALGLGAFWFAICLASRGRLCQGSMLTASISRLVPSLAGTFVASFAWFWLAESIESGHAWAPTWCIVLALLFAAAVVRHLAFVGLRNLAKSALLCDTGDFKSRTPSWIAISDRPIVGIPVVRALRLFSRPPPTRFSY